MIEVFGEQERGKRRGEDLWLSVTTANNLAQGMAGFWEGGVGGEKELREGLRVVVEEEGRKREKENKLSLTSFK